MLDSIRFRLALWFTAILALILIAFAVTAYVFQQYAVAKQTDNTLRELSHTLVELIESEGGDKEGSIPSGDATRAAIDEAMSDLQYRNYQLLIFDSALQPAAVGSPGRNRPSITAAEIAGQLTLFASSSNETDLKDLATNADRFRIFIEKEKLANEQFIIVVAHSLHEEAELSRMFLITLAISIPIALVLACFGGYFLARKSLAPVASMAGSAEKIGAANLNKRLPVNNPKDELGSLATVINSLLDRIENAFEDQRRFMADASHELRTPVAILQGESEVALLRADRSNAEYKESLSVVNDESKRLAKIVEDLFTLARADSGQIKPDFRPLYLDEVVADAVRSVRTLAVQKDIVISFTKSSAMPFYGDDSQLRRLFLNLLDNAIKYSDRGRTVLVLCEDKGDHYLTTVADNGFGIPQDMVEKIFYRFFRLDEVRGRNQPAGGAGAGLGLSIAKWIAEFHEGQIIVESSLNKGSTFKVCLPKQVELKLKDDVESRGPTR